MRNLILTFIFLVIQLAALLWCSSLPWQFGKRNKVNETQ